MVIGRIANGVTLAGQSFFWWSLSATNLVRYMDASEDVSRTALMQVPGDRAAFWYSLAPFSMAVRSVKGKSGGCTGAYASFPPLRLRCYICWPTSTTRMQVTWPDRSLDKLIPIYSFWATVFLISFGALIPKCCNRAESASFSRGVQVLSRMWILSQAYDTYVQTNLSASYAPWSSNSALQHLVDTGFSLNAHGQTLW